MSRVVVVGGGPAGLAAATRLALGGADVTLLEAGHYPRPRLCGEFLSPDAASALDAIGLADLPRELGAPLLEAVRVTVTPGHGRTTEAYAPLEAPGWGVSRHVLDARLAREAGAAGVRVLTGRRVAALDLDSSDGVCARSSGDEFRAAAAVIATGRLARPAGAEDARERRGVRGWVGVKTHVRGLDLPGVTELHFVGGAYVGLNEVTLGGERAVNVCALVGPAFWERSGRSAAGVWQRLAAESPPFSARWRRARPVGASAAAAARFDFDTRGSIAGSTAGETDLGTRLSARRSARPALVVGDAAALIAPLCGDGQGMALHGGVAVADALLRHGAARDVLPQRAVHAAAGEWERSFARSARRRLLVGRALQSLLLRPGSAAWVLRAARALRPLSAWLYRSTRGPYSGSRPASQPLSAARPAGR